MRSECSLRFPSTVGKSTNPIACLPDASIYPLLCGYNFSLSVVGLTAWLSVWYLCRYLACSLVCLLSTFYCLPVKGLTASLMFVVCVLPAFLAESHLVPICFLPDACFHACLLDAVCQDVVAILPACQPVACFVSVCCMPFLLSMRVI